MEINRAIESIRQLLGDPFAIMSFVQVELGGHVDEILSDYLEGHCPLWGWGTEEFLELLQIDLPELGASIETRKKGMEVTQSAENFVASERGIDGIHFTFQKEGDEVQFLPPSRSRGLIMASLLPEPHWVRPRVQVQVWWVPRTMVSLTYQESQATAMGARLARKGHGGFRHFDRVLGPPSNLEALEVPEKMALDCLGEIDKLTGSVFSSDLIRSSTLRCRYIGARLRGLERHVDPTNGRWDQEVPI